MLKISCPDNPKHNRFSTTAHVMQDWVVDENGEHTRTLDQCLQIDEGPTKGNCFTCMRCGAEAIVEEV